jgi:glycerol-3-phosphate O-acyltransferase
MMTESATPALPSPRHAPLWALLLGKLLAPWIRLRIEPADDVAQLAADARPLCYVLERYGLSNALILERACRESGLPSPLTPLAGDPLGHKRAYIALSRRRGAWFGRPRTRTHSEGLEKLLDRQRTHPDLDIQLVPVSIFIGRAPDRQSGWFSVLFSENWELVGRFRRLLAVLLNGRNTIVQFATPVPLRTAIAENLPPERTVRKLSRVLRVHFARIRAAVIGPDLSHRRLLVDKVLESEPVRQALADQARRDNKPVEDAWRKAHAIAWEIAADYSHPVVRSLSFMLTPFWNRIYDGVQVHHLDTLKDIAPGHEVVYVPSHRSHIDYLLLSYLLYSHNIVPPHIVAGVNLNMPLIGPLLRKGGAFFIRRSIRGSALYSTLLGEYVALLVGEGFSLEYFIEGGRSRTGRLLQPKSGMLAMTVRGFLRQPRRPVVFQPVYIGYEKLMEGKSYLDELTGGPKQKETVWALLRGALGVLRKRYGRVAVSFGEPILLDDILQQHAPDWREHALGEDERPKWLGEAMDDLAQRIQVNINRSADVNPVNLLALTLLSSPKHAMTESDLLEQLALGKRLLAAVPYSDRVTVTDMEPAQIIAYGAGIGILQRTAHPLGDVLSMDDETAVLQTYYRNNVLHLFTAPAWVACCFQNNRKMSRTGVLRLGRTLYPFLQSELFLPWTQEGFGDCLQATITQFIAEGLLKFDAETDTLRRGPGQTDAVFRLRTIARSLQQAFERYFIAIAVLVKNGPHTLSTGELESLCQMTAQRLSLLYAPAAPEFFDRTLFRGFIQKIREIGLVKTDAEGKLDYGDELDAWAKDARVILGRELRHTILKITPETARAAAPAPAATPTD